MPIPLMALGLGSAGASLLGAGLSYQKPVNYGDIMSQYFQQLAPAYQNQFMGGYNALGGLTMGAGNAADYADASTAAFQRSAAYQALLANYANQANRASMAARGNAAMGQNFGVGQAAWSLANPGSMLNAGIGNALLQQYMQGQGQFGQLAGMRLQGAGQMAQGGAGLAGQAFSQYQQQPSFWNRIGGGLMGLGGAGMQAAMMGGMQGGGGGANPFRQPGPWRQ